ncbi:MAG: 5-formyltetrahydrofolate cyclo-ligase [Chitinophagales bacterium]|nr:5-formyltetrahydrofolate cyclo-ligase [Chitinophagales bacterium]
MIKKDLRRIYKEKRTALSSVEKAKLDDLLLIQFQQARLPFIQTLFSYWPMEQFREPDMHLFTDFMEFSNPELLIAYPRTNPATLTMDAVIVDEETSFAKNSFGVYEPEGTVFLQPADMDMVFVPLLTFDKRGYRVGYGKGYYDRFLAACRPGCVKVGFSFFEPVEEIRDTHEFDVTLNLCITPQSIYVF